MGQNSHRKYVAFKNAEEKLKPWSSKEDKQAVKIKELEYQLQKKKDDEEYERTDAFFNRINGRD